MIEINCKEVEDLPDGLAIVATGPLTSESLASRLKEVVGEDFLYFFDAVAPIVTAESIDMSKAYRASRYGKGEDYINCPLTEEEYYAFWEALVSAERIPLKDFERDGKFFEGCMPVEVLAQRGKDTLRYGPMRPVGLEDPKDGKRPFAVVQLRQENKAGTMYNLVGFQTNLKWKEQERVFRMIPALKNAEFVRFGVMHRNIYVNAPKVLDVEGYVESTAMGLVAGINAACQARGLSLPLWPMETAIGSLMNHLSEERPHGFQPMNMNLGLFPPLGERIKDRSQRLARHAERAKRALEAFLAENKMLVIEKD
jgi:methylenetetrahydrofolate--tRNA-(uracil-5-)-methyltransferase